MTDKILVPVDFSDYSKEAIQRARVMATRFDAEVVLGHAVAPTLYPEGMGYGSPTHADLKGELHDRLEELGREFLGDDVKWRAMVWTGTPYRSITDSAKDLDIDLIVLPTHGRTGISHLVMGSTAERVVRTAPCDVLVVCVEGCKKAAG